MNTAKKKKPAPQAALFDGAAPSYTNPKPAPRYVLEELVEKHGVPRKVVERFSARGAFAKLRECRLRAERKANQPTPQQRRDALLVRLRQAVTDVEATSEDFYNMVCEGMCEMTAAELRSLVVEAALILFHPAPKTDAPLPF